MLKTIEDLRHEVNVLVIEPTIGLIYESSHRLDPNDVARVLTEALGVLGAHTLFAIEDASPYAAMTNFVALLMNAMEAEVGVILEAINDADESGEEVN